MLKNLIRSRHRATRRRKEREHLTPCSRRPLDPAETLRLKELRLDIIQALMSLVKEQRDVLLLRFYHDYQPARIARILRVPVETVKTRQIRGLATLRRLLDTRYGGPNAWVW